MKFIENVELDAQLMAAVFNAKNSREATAEVLNDAANRLGLKGGSLEAFNRLKDLSQYKDHYDYRNAVLNRLKEIDLSAWEDFQRGIVEAKAILSQIGGRIKETIVDGEEAIIVRADDLNPDAIEQLKGLGLDPTPEMAEFVSQIAESVIENSPLAQPYIQAGVVKLSKATVAPGIEANAVHFHRTKFAEMVKNPATHAN